MEECKKYLKEAKQKQWAIDIGDLMKRFNLTHYQVITCINQVF